MSKLSQSETSLEETRSKLELTEDQLETKSAKLQETSMALVSMEEAKEQVEADLAIRTAERDDVRTRLEEVTAALASAERLATERSQRIDTLESELASTRSRLEAEVADLRARLETAETKLSNDAALLERVRKALSIGMGLLEEQRS